jgi:hypothetical protein
MLATRLRGKNVVAVFCVEREPAHDPHDRRRRSERNRYDDIEAAGPEVIQNQYEEHHDGERQKDIANQRDRLIPPAAKITGQQAEECADRICE